MLLGRWQAIFYVVTVATVITASGSLVAGWALWTEPGWKIMWSTFAGGAALIAIIHNALGVPSRFRTLENAYGEFTQIRIDAETLKRAIAGISNEPAPDDNGKLSEVSLEYSDLRERLKKALATRPTDVLTRNKMISLAAARAEDRSKKVFSSRR
jgi:hypothetical protein